MAQTGRRYQTRQKELVYSCLRGHPDAYLNARQILALLSGQGHKVGIATIYRNLHLLAAEGVVTKSQAAGKEGAGYRFVGESAGEREKQENCFYLKCEVCGSLAPIECEELKSFYGHFSEEHHVRIDPVKTVLYGTCSDCLDEDGAEGTSAAPAADAGPGPEEL